MNRLDINRLFEDQSSLLNSIQPGTNLTLNIITYNNYGSDSSILKGDASNVKNGGINKMKTFIILKPGEDGQYIAECPSMPGCISQGETKEQALTNIKEAVELYLELVNEDPTIEKPYEVHELEV